MSVQCCESNDDVDGQDFTICLIKEGYIEKVTINKAKQSLHFYTQYSFN